MTDYYTQFSFVVPTPTETDAKELALEINAELERFRAWYDADDRLDEEFTSPIFGSLGDDSNWPDLNVDAEKVDVWIHNDESGDVELAAAATQWILKQLDKPYFIFEWGCTASRPIEGAYGGGTVLVEQNEIRYQSTGITAREWDKEMREVHQR